MKYVIANWKENKNLDEAEIWLDEFIKLSQSSPSLFEQKEIKIVVCPSFPLIISLFQKLKELNYQSLITNYQLLSLGSQNISRFEKGAYTGEISVTMIKDFVDYAIVGHSERRKYFGETNEIVNEKIKLCLKHEVAPIVCVANLEQVRTIRSEKSKADLHFSPLISHLPLLAFEPIEAIGTGQPDTPEHAQKMAKKIKEIMGDDVAVVYGGSVNNGNVGEFVKQKDVEGVLVGKASLDPEEFYKIVEKLIETKC